MTRRLPPLNQLRAFEAAARLGSFKAAADELHVTHTAVSHQIKALEEELARPLFRRITRGVELLPEAEKLVSELSRSFDAITQAVDEVRARTHAGKLRISAVPAFGYRYVIPRLPKFRKQQPDLDIEFVLNARLADLDTGEFDAALRYGKGDWPGLDRREIFRDRMAPIAAPSLLDGRKTPLDAAEIAALPFAVSAGSRTDWDSWCRLLGLDNPARPTPLTLENRAVMLDFVLSGAGIALIDLTFASKELETGNLVQLHPETISGVNATYLAWKRMPVPDPRLTVFGDWLVGEVTNHGISDPA